MKRQAEWGGSRNSKTTDRLSGDTVGSQCRPRHRESVPHITLLKSRLPYVTKQHRTVNYVTRDDAFGRFRRFFRSRKATMRLALPVLQIYFL